jgi:hypothetical protein
LLCFLPCKILLLLQLLLVRFLLQSCLSCKLRLLLLLLLVQFLQWCFLQCMSCKLLLLTCHALAYICRWSGTLLLQQQLHQQCAGDAAAVPA